MKLLIYVVLYGCVIKFVILLLFECECWRDDDISHTHIENIELCHEVYVD